MEIQKFAKKWIKSWNSHDLDGILSYYSEDIEVTTPMIKRVLENETGTLKGKELVADYWKQLLIKMPDLYFELVSISEGVASLALCYKSAINKKTVEVMFFNDQGQVNRVIVHYT